jgi:hypothetical protein
VGVNAIFFVDWMAFARTRWRATIRVAGRQIHLRFMTMFGLFGLGGGFLVISPELRDSVMDASSRGQQLLQANQPYSYIALGGCGVLAMVVYMYRCSQPR